MPSRETRRTTGKGARAQARIVAEAGRIFSQDGYRAGSLAAIAAAAGLTQQGLLHYFPTKADLLLAVVEERDARTAKFVADQDDSGSIVDTFVEAVRHNAGEPHLVELMTVLSAESVSPGHPTHDWFINRYDRLVDHIAVGIAFEQQAGSWHADAEPERTARILVGLADGLRLQRLLGHPGLDHPGILAEMVELLRSTAAPPAQHSEHPARQQRPTARG